MKNIFIILILLFLGCGAPGTVARYYQVHQLQSPDVDNRTMIYENSTIMISYDFWAEGGFSKCLISNMTDSIIFLHLDLSHFVFNGMAYPYYTHKAYNVGVSVSGTTNTYYRPYYSWQYYTWPYNTVSGVSTGNSTTTNKSESITESPMMVIPPHTSKYIPGFNIGQLYNDCDLKTHKDSVGISFDLNNTPYRFSNMLFYTVEKPDGTRRMINNRFWVSSVSNMTFNTFFDYYNPTVCGKKQMYSEYYAIQKATNKYYLRY
jgi:hypothetical protein